MSATAIVTSQFILSKPCPAMFYVNQQLQVNCHLQEGHEGAHEIKIQWTAP